MSRVAVASRTLTSVSYFSEMHLLELEFRTGAIYQYFDVPQLTYHELLEADSKGGYFNHNIRNRFHYELVRAPYLAVGKSPALRN